jgi:hypothetical protein
MKVNILEAHDRYQHFTKQSFNIAECCQDLINQRPFGNHPFYIFAHTRTDEDGVTKRLIWQPRLTKPKSTTNSMLFKAYPGSDQVKVIWMIPDRLMWDSYKVGNITESETVLYSIDMFDNHRAILDAKEEDDLTDEKANEVYRELSVEARRKKYMEKLHKQGVVLPKQDSLVVF